MSLDRRAAALAALVALALAASLAHSPERLLDAAAGVAADPLLFALVVVGLYSLRPLVLWPTTLVAVVVGYGYGIVLGLPIALVGAVYTSVPPYYAARWLGADAPSIARLRDAGQRFFDATGDLRGVTAGRLAPVPADAVTCAAALSGVRFRTLAGGVLLGELPWTVAAVVVGSSLATLTVEGLGALGTQVAVVTALAALALLIGPAYRAILVDNSLPSASSYKR